MDLFAELLDFNTKASTVLVELRGIGIDAFT
jgi:hypothetical protein